MLSNWQALYLRRISRETITLHKKCSLCTLFRCW